MKIALGLCLLLTIISSEAFASKIVKSLDTKNSCELYKVVFPDEFGNTPLKAGEEIFSKVDVYGMSFTSMEIDFDNHRVLVQPIMNVVFAINPPLIENKVIIEENNENFLFLINQLNRKFQVFHKVCIADDKVIYAKFFEDESVSDK